VHEPSLVDGAAGQQLDRDDPVLEPVTGQKPPVSHLEASILRIGLGAPAVRKLGGHGPCSVDQFSVCCNEAFTLAQVVMFGIVSSFGYD